MRTGCERILALRADIAVAMGKTVERGGVGRKELSCAFKAEFWLRLDAIITGVGLSLGKNVEI